MKARFFALLLASAALAACAAAPERTSRTMLPDDARSSPGHYIVVTVRNDAVRGSARAASTAKGYDSIAPYSVSSTAIALARDLSVAYGLREAASWPIAMLGVNCIVYETPPESDQAHLLQQLSRDRRVESAQPLATFATQSAAYNDPYAGLQQSLGQMDIARAQQWSQGDGVTLAVIDTGVDAAHPDLQGRVAGQRNFVDGDAKAFAADLHGTAVAGVIAAVANNRIGIAGIAPAVRLVAYKACWQLSVASSTAACNTFTLAQALAAAIDAHADIVNLSLAGPDDPLLRRIVERGVRQGTIFVGAAPPAGARAGFPGNIDGVITVDAPGRRVGTAATLTAPGDDVLTLVPNDHYDFASGSSLAAAQVSAVAALLLARDHRLHADDLRNLLVQTSRPVTTPGGTFTTVNACEALVALLHQGSCSAPDDADTTSLPATDLHAVAAPARPR